MADAETTTPARDDGAFDTALAQFHTLCQAQQEERALSLADRRFVFIAGAQWEGDWADQFANSIMVEVNKTAQGVEKIFADYRAHRFTVDFRALTDNPQDQETSETLNGLFLADAYRSKAQQAFDGSFEEAVAGGMGAWRLCNEYENEYDEDSEHQRIAFKWIPDADQSVFFDMDARLYDKSDAKFCFVVTAMSPEAYKDKYEDDPASWPQDIVKSYYDWYTPDVVRVAEYYRVVEKTETRLFFTHSITGEQKRVWDNEREHGDIAELRQQGWRQMGRKPVKRRSVEKLTFSAGGEIADRQEIAGDQIPVIPVYGKRWFVDNMERVRGHVRLAKDPQRIYNAQISKLMELTALSPSERPIFTSDQIAGHEQQWADANINRAPYAVINALTDPTTGSPIPTGPVGAVTPPQVPPAQAALIQITAHDIAELTTNQDNSDEVKPNVSAEAMDIAATRTDAKAFVYIDNFKQSMQRCGEVYLSMAKAVYVEEDREVPTMDEEGQQGSAQLNDTRLSDQGVKYLANDFNSVKLNIIADVSEATSTRRDKTVRSLTTSAQAVAPFDPQGASAMMGVAMLNMDGEGMDDLQEWWRKRLVQQGVVKPTDEEKKQMEEAQAQAGQQPDPQAQVLAATVEKEKAQTVKAQAQTEQIKASTVKVLTEAHAAHHDAQASLAAAPLEAAQKEQAHRVGMFEKMAKVFAPKGTG